MLRTRKPTPRLHRGFTLIEVLLVLAILGVIAAMVVPQLVGRQKEAMVKTAQLKIKTLEKQAELYAVDHDGEYPPGPADSAYQLMMNPVDEQTGQARQPYLTEIPLDPWKVPLNYEYPPTGNRQTLSGKPAIWSNGPDRQEGTADDITNWNVNAI